MTLYNIAGMIIFFLVIIIIATVVMIFQIKKHEKFGCALSVIIFAIMIIAGTMSNRPKLEISEDQTRGFLKFTIMADNGPSRSSRDLAKYVYNTAKANPHMKFISVELIMDVTSKVVDKYGNKLEGPFMMGTIREGNLDEIRLYHDGEYYASRSEDYYLHKLLALDNAQLFSKD